MPTPRTPRTAVLCAALDLEHQAITEHLTGTVGRETVNGAVYDIGGFASWRVVVALTGRDNAPTAAQVERAISAFSPRVAIFVGIAGGRRKVRHGDVVAASHIYDYQSGRDTDSGLRPRVKTLDSTYAALQRAHAVVRDRQWQRRITTGAHGETPAARIGPLASGGTVVTGVDSDTARFIERHCDDALGIEMEGYGFLRGARAHNGVESLVVRGISDLLGDKGVSADRQWQPLAARHAAAFAFEVLHHMDVDDSPPPDAEREPRSVTYVASKGDNNTLNIGGFGEGARGEVNVRRED
ncbi:MAG TPA: hypothetical protein VE172_13790 [Stackebrandtia sp.]|uniref:5'-methylthioadenosine/S-adenosylhomocysteine nucleosidase family protein n=1 Tax=Stackebrandtia sp. TaxID=2023065 RepID=UPI002D3032E6|nr:hypothetical protein [Stackebrandtia sp.]HZE39874.1 hypothetical protein [Stackebrandtia sp.]